MLLKIERINSLRKYTNPLLLNHIEGLKGITNKANLLRSLKRFYTTNSIALEHKYNILDTMPETFIHEIGGDDAEYIAFLQRFVEISQKLFRKDHTPAKHCQQNVWLIKPSNQNQGRGIEIVKTMKEIKSFFENKPLHSQWVIQKYLEKPLLYKGRKFDIRMWALVTDRADVFYFKEGYIRTSSDNYTLETNENYVHLTNNCLQQFGSNYGKHEDGNTLGFSYIREYIKNAFSEKSIEADFDQHIIPRIRDLIIDTILSVKNDIIVSLKKRGCAFELLGYDFMIDEDLRVWLIEVNTNPYLGIPNDYIRGLLPKMMDNMFDIVLKFSYMNNATKSPAKTNREFELIYCEKNSQYSETVINKHRGYSKDLIYPVKEILINDHASSKNLASLRISCNKIALRCKELNQPGIAHFRNKTDNSLYATQIGLTPKIQSPTDFAQGGPNKVIQKLKQHKKSLPQNLEDYASDIIKNESFSILPQFTAKLFNSIKNSGPHNEKDIIASIKIIAKSKMIYAFISDNESEFRNLQKIALSYNSEIPLAIRMCLVFFNEYDFKSLNYLNV